MVRRLVAGVGRTLITMGVLLLLFVAYQLWGTGIATARAQDQLGTAFDRQLAASGISLPELPAELGGPSTVTTTKPPTDEPPTSDDPNVVTPSVTDTVPPTTAAPTTTRELTSHAKTKALPLAEGEAIGQIRIPRISLTRYLVEGTTVDALKKGPGHYKGTPLPGEPGNAAIAGHRTTYGAPFFRMDELQVGDPIFVYTLRSKQWFRYEMTSFEVVKPSQSKVLQPIPGRNTLTLTTCNPRYSASQRLIIHADLVGATVEADVEAAPQDPFAADLTTTTAIAPTETTVAPAAAVTPSTAVPPTTEALAPDTSVAAADTTVPVLGDALGSDSVGDPSELTLDSRRSNGKQIGFSWLRGPSNVWAHTIAWAMVCALLWLGTWLAVHRRRRMLVRWAGYGVVFVVLFLPALYLCYENLARLLPENV